MKVGDLAMTHKGNMCLVTEVGKNIFGRIDWYSIIFCGTGVRRTGYPAAWLRRHKGESR
jgi:hypothetical protein